MNILKLYGVMRAENTKGNLARNTMVNLSGLIKPHQPVHWTENRRWAEDVMRSKELMYPVEKYIIVEINDPFIELLTHLSKRKDNGNQKRNRRNTSTKGRNLR